MAWRHVALLALTLPRGVTPTCPSTSIPEEQLHELPRDEIVRMLRSCAHTADQRQTVLRAASAVLAADTTANPLIAGARAVLDSLAGEADEPLPPPPQARSSAAAAPRRTELATWHESEDDQRAAQRAQAELVRTRLRPGRPHTRIPVSPSVREMRWEVACEPLLYRLGPPAVPQCTPAIAAAADAGLSGASRSVEGRRCARVLRDGFISAEEAEALIGVVERSMAGLFHQGAQTSFAPDARSAVKQMGAAGRALFAEVQERVRRSIAADFGLPALYGAGTLFTRIWADELIPADGMDVEPGHRYDNLT